MEDPLPEACLWRLEDSLPEAGLWRLEDSLPEAGLWRLEDPRWQPQSWAVSSAVGAWPGLCVGLLYGTTLREALVLQQINIVCCNVFGPNVFHKGTMFMSPVWQWAFSVLLSLGFCNMLCLKL